ncbi:MAG TPA: CAP domain-containing protein [Pyrinomonadaceae bacterium]|nr:CAP domain-containing protein [Pyrinomonadaceae bacterium]
MFKLPQLPLFALGLVALLSTISFAQTAVPVRLASADNIEDLFRPRIVGGGGAARVKSLEHRAFDIINRKRSESGLEPLAWSDQLEPVARVHSENMANFDFFSHKGLDNKYVSDRADDAHIGKWRAIGENIAFAKGYADPVELAVELWLNSTGHRRNMLDASWRESAVGVAVAPDGSYYFTQVFLKK